MRRKNFSKKRRRRKHGTDKILFSMKKVLLIIATALMSAVAVSAQDMAQATETYNNGAMALQAGNNAEAIDNFKSALVMAEACGEEGAEIVNNCREYIPKIMFSIAKDTIKDGDLDKGLAEIDEAIAKAKEYGVTEVIEDAEALKPQVLMNRANNLLNAKDFDGAIAAYNDIIKTDPSNGIAQLRLGVAYAQAGNTEKAAEAYIAAAANGQEKAADKQLSNLYLKEAQTALKAKDYAAAYDSAVKANDVLASGNACYIAGMAAQKLGQDSKATEAFEKFLTVAPKDKRADDIKCTLAVSYQKAGNKDKAIEFYQQILTNPKYTEVAKAQIAALQK